MDNIFWIIIITAISGVIGTGLGGVIGSLFNKNSNRVVSLLLSFAGGVMTAIVCFELMDSALNPIEGEASTPWYIVVIFTILGYLIVWGLNELIDKKLKKEIPHTSENHPDVHDDLDEMIHADHLSHHKKEGTNLFVAGLVMALVIALHNLPEGLVIGASFAIDSSSLCGSGMIIAVVIGLHNIPEGMAVSVPLMAGGTKRWKAILASAASGAPTIIGAIVGYYVGISSTVSLSICLALASGAMLYVVFAELLPESIMMWKSKLPALLVFVGLLIGFIVVLI